jgi:hypothetical protein
MKRSMILVLLCGCTTITPQQEQEDLRIDAWFVAQHFIEEVVTRPTFPQYNDEAAYEKSKDTFNVDSYFLNRKGQKVEFFCTLKYTDKKTWILT